jgi:hypothetical protein
MHLLFYLVLFVLVYGHNIADIHNAEYHNPDIDRYTELIANESSPLPVVKQYIMTVKNLNVNSAQRDETFLGCTIALNRKLSSLNETWIEFQSVSLFRGLSTPFMDAIEQTESILAEPLVETSCIDLKNRFNVTEDEYLSHFIDAACAQKDEFDILLVLNKLINPSSVNDDLELKLFVENVILIHNIMVARAGIHESDILHIKPLLTRAVLSVYAVQLVQRYSPQDLSSLQQRYLQTMIERVYIVDYLMIESIYKCRDTRTRVTMSKVGPEATQWMLTRLNNDDQIIRDLLNGRIVDGMSITHLVQDPFKFHDRLKNNFSILDGIIKYFKKETLFHFVGAFKHYEEVKEKLIAESFNEEMENLASSTPHILVLKMMNWHFGRLYHLKRPILSISNIKDSIDDYDIIKSYEYAMDRIRLRLI